MALLEAKLGDRCCLWQCWRISRLPYPAKWKDIYNILVLPRRPVNHLSLPLTFVHPLVPLPLPAPLESSAFSGFSSTRVTAVMILRASSKLCPSMFLFLTCTAASPSNRSPPSSHSCSCKSSHSALFISPIKVFLGGSTITVICSSSTAVVAPGFRRFREPVRYEWDMEPSMGTGVGFCCPAVAFSLQLLPPILDISSSKGLASTQ